MNHVCQSSFGRVVGDSPTIPVKDFDHEDMLEEVFLPLDLLVIGPIDGACRGFFPFSVC